MKTRSGTPLVGHAGRVTELRVPVVATTGAAYATLAVPIGTLTALAE